MASNSERGARAKARSKEWCKKHGYPVCDMELVRIVHTLDGKFPTKRDQWGADLQYLQPAGAVMLQVKLGGKPTGTYLKEAQKKFDDHSFPASVRLELHVWRPGARQPEIIECPIKNIL
jgi:hypothetical protein